MYCGKDGANKDTLYKYILHRAYNFGFNTKASIASRDAVFIPSGAVVTDKSLPRLMCRIGYDTPSKAEILHDGLKSFQPDDAFGDVIVAPASRTVRIATCDGLNLTLHRLQARKRSRLRMNKSSSRNNNHCLVRQSPPHLLARDLALVLSGMASKGCLAAHSDR